MKRTTRKLVVRSETVRVLGLVDMARVAGGDAQELGTRSASEATCVQAQLTALGVIVVVVPNR